MYIRNAWIFFVFSFAPCAGHAQIFNMGELNASQIKSFDRDRTVVLIPGGILEEHGPYLPVYTDGYADRYYTNDLARAIAMQPGWTVVVLPEIPLGFGGANNIGAKWDFSGTFTIRLATFRSVYMDLLGALGEQRFRWIFVVHDHGDPAHNQALEQASDYFHDTYGGTMVHLFGLTEVLGCRDTTTLLSKEANQEDGFTVHAGAEEHSEMLFLRPELVSPSYKHAPTVTASSFEDLYTLAEKDTWPGYFGAPSKASGEVGRQIMANCSRALAAVALHVLGGYDYRKLPRYYDKMDPRDAIGVQAERQHDREIEAKQRQWLKSKGLE
jgi:creatinine amidohydrolase/Fe(II)-dependent formamide hydrolase-like protein